MASAAESHDDGSPAFQLLCPWVILMQMAERIQHLLGRLIPLCGVWGHPRAAEAALLAEEAERTAKQALTLVTQSEEAYRSFRNRCR